MKSWRTTIVGVLTAITLIAPQLLALLDNDPATVFSLDLFIAGLGAMGIGIFARDNDKSSENVGVR